MQHAQHKDSLINIRALTAQKDLIDKAAAYLHKTRSDFILDIVCQAAENVLLDQRLFLADEQSFNKFENLLDSPVEDNLGLKDLLSSKSPWEN